jgi:hypothetical protein
MPAMARPRRLELPGVLYHITARGKPNNPLFSTTLISRSSNRVTVYLLRRPANQPVQTVAIHFLISPSRISKIQRAIDGQALSPAALPVHQVQRQELTPPWSFALLKHFILTVPIVAKGDSSLSR